MLLGFGTDFGVDCLAFPVSTFPLPALVWLVLLLLETLLGFLNAVLVVLFTAALDVFPSEARDTISVFPSENDDSSSDPSKASSSNSSSSSDLNLELKFNSSSSSSLSQETSVGRLKDMAAS